MSDAPQAAVDSAKWAMIAHQLPDGSMDCLCGWRPSSPYVVLSEWREHSSEAVAAAVVAAVHGPIKAEAWGDAADLIAAEHQSEKQRLAAFPDHNGLLANWLGGFSESARLLRARADEIGVQP